MRNYTVKYKRTGSNDFHFCVVYASSEEDAKHEFYNNITLVDNFGNKFDGSLYVREIW